VWGLTILSPCILPVLPFVFARSDQPFTRSGLPIFLGMAITFAAAAIIVGLHDPSTTDSREGGDRCLI
jgi:cytochrome c biogenesis protein CcdA